jgi:hypothetical protein
MSAETEEHNGSVGASGEADRKGEGWREKGMTPWYCLHLHNLWYLHIKII